jgi:outer membrane immunogenic protein
MLRCVGVFMRCLASGAVFALLSFIPLVAAGSANAQGYNWSGFTVDAFIAHGDASVDPSLAPPPAGPPTLSPSGFFGGGALRYDWQFANGVIIGAVADIGAGNDLEDRKFDGNFIQQYAEITSLGTVRANLGATHGPIMAYVTGGWAWAEAEYGETCPSGAQFGFCRPAAAGPYDNKDSHFASGGVAGAGVRAMYTENIVVGAEFLHMDFGNDTYALGVSSTGRKVTDKPNDIDVNSFRLSIGYHFN